MLKLKSILVLIVGIGTVIAAPTILEVKPQMIKVNGKSVQSATIVQPNGTWGYYPTAGGDFDVIVKNDLAESTVIHWHGLIMPNHLDGVAGLTQVLPIASGQQQHYKFKLQQAGTYWMHSHQGMQEQIGVEAPLIVLNKADLQQQQVVVMFQDFSFKTPLQIMSKLDPVAGATSHSMDMAPVITKPSASKMAMEHGSMSGMSAHDMAGMQMDDESESGNMHSMADMDLNDVDYDAYLTNYHSPDRPQITQVMAGKTVRLRFINGASGSNFWINLGNLNGKLVAVDGQAITPLTGSRFELAIGQRADILLTIPKTGGTFPILGQVEGLKSQTGLLLTTLAKPKSISIESQAVTVAPALDYAEELKLHSSSQVPTIKNTANLELKLTGDMQNYIWKINDQTWPNITPLQVVQGQRVIMTFTNQSMMAHPMHLHGYQFKVINVNGQRIDGAMRDTILVLPDSSVTVEFIASNSGKWMLHCHMLYHMGTGMMTYLDVIPSK